MEKQDIRIGEMRPYYGSSKAVTIKMPEAGGKKLLAKGKIRVEYNWCRVDERVDLTQCYRC